MANDVARPRVAVETHRRQAVRHRFGKRVAETLELRTHNVKVGCPIPPAYINRAARQPDAPDQADRLNLMFQRLAIRPLAKDEQHPVGEILGQA